jgi:hypothetical protein
MDIRELTKNIRSMEEFKPLYEALSTLDMIDCEAGKSDNELATLKAEMERLRSGIFEVSEVLRNGISKNVVQHNAFCLLDALYISSGKTLEEQ